MRGGGKNLRFLANKLLDDLQRHWQPVRLAILAIAGLFVHVWCLN